MNPHPVYLTAPRNNCSSCQESATLTCCGSSTEEASEWHSLRAWQVAMGCTLAVWCRGKTFLVTFLWRRGTLQTFMSCMCSCHLHQPGSTDLSPLWPLGRARVHMWTWRKIKNKAHASRPNPSPTSVHWCCTALHFCHQDSLGSCLNLLNFFRVSDCGYSIPFSSFLWISWFHLTFYISF